MYVYSNNIIIVIVVLAYFIGQQVNMAKLKKNEHKLCGSFYLD